MTEHKLETLKTRKQQTTTAHEEDYVFEFHGIKIRSVFDVIEHSKEQYISQSKSPRTKQTGSIATNKENDISIKAGQLYDYASILARQISRAHMDRPVIEPTKTRSKRDFGEKPNSYMALFEEDWSRFCAPDDIAAIDSPAAYLRALYKFAGHLETLSDLKANRTIDSRRPDLADLTINAGSVYEARSLYQLINNVLEKKIQQAAFKEGKSTLKLMAAATYPLSLPYNHYHRQCTLALAAKQLAPGILDYTLTFKLPAVAFLESDSEGIEKLREAQLKMSNLSPEQITVLTGKPAEYNHPNNVLSGLQEDTFRKEEIANGQCDLQLLARQTECSPSRIATLLDLQFMKSYPSPTSHLVLEGADKQTVRLMGEEHPNQSFFSALDRLQRIIRLNTWTRIPLEKLDILIHSAINSRATDDSVGSLAAQNTIENSTLRALGVYQYFTQRYSIEADEFAALLHDIPTHSIDDQPSLFDRVFHRNPAAAQPFKMNRQGQGVEGPLGQLADALGLQLEQDSLYVFSRNTQKALGNLKHNRETVSSLYRQARIARMFGLSPSECIALVDLLGGEKLLSSFAMGTLSDVTADILHLLLAMDWTINWMRSAGLTMAQLCRMLGRTSSVPHSPALNKHLSAIRAMKNTASAKQKTLAVQQLLQDVMGLGAAYVPCVMKMVNSSEEMLLAELKSSKTALLVKCLSAGEVCLALHIKSDDLSTFLEKPELLISDWKADLTLRSLYYLERFAYYCRQKSFTDNKLIAYLNNVTQYKNTPFSLAQKANTDLASLINGGNPVDALTATFDNKCVDNLEKLDWINRCLDACNRTGLSPDSLLQSLALNSKSSMTQFQNVALALLPTLHAQGTRHE